MTREIASAQSPQGMAQASSWFGDQRSWRFLSVCGHSPGVGDLARDHARFGLAGMKGRPWTEVFSRPHAGPGPGCVQLQKVYGGRA